MTHPVSQVTKAAFSFEISNEDDAVHIRLAGNGDMEASPVLSRQVSVVHAHAQQHKARIVFFDLTRLYFLNSSCLKSLASLIALNAKLDANAQYKIIFRLGLPWQRRSILALQSLGRGSVIVEDCAASIEESS